MADKRKMLVIKGKPISSGLAEGIIHIHRNILGPIDIPGNKDIEKCDVEEEFSKLDDATAKVSDDLLTLASRVEKEIDSRLAKVFGAHKLMVNDSSLRSELRREIVENLVNASSAVKTVFLRWEKRFLLMESQISRDKGDDIRDVSNRLCNALAGITIHPLEDIPHDSIVVTTRLLASDTIFLANRKTLAVLLEYGSSGSHAALFAREMGLPCISGFPDLLKTVSDGSLALVDADTGTVTINPGKKQKTLFRKKVEEKKNIYRLTHKLASTPAFTKNNVAISVLANVGCQADTERAMQNGADGIGLYRLERAYLGRIIPPDKDELVWEMRHTLEPAKGHPVCIRLLDIGTDKPLPFLKFLVESNPSLGRRGVRLFYEYPELLRTNLLAILELTKDFDISILIPMVTLAEDAELVKEYLSRLGSELQLATLPKLGAMIETPAAALSAQKITKYVDFLSFGTNDLTQFAFAVDRESAAMERYFKSTSDVIFRLLKLTHDDVPDVPLSLCGELAGCPGLVSRLLECGIRTLSVAPPLIPVIKEAIRNSSFASYNQNLCR